MMLSQLISELQKIYRETGEQPVEITASGIVNSGEYHIYLELRDFTVESVVEVIPPPARRYTQLDGEAVPD